MRLLLIRHGQTPHNVTGALDTSYPGAGLTDLGHRQAAAIPSALAGRRIDGIYASRLIRTQLTAAPLAEARGLEVVVQDGLEEISAGDLELRSDDDAVREYAECHAAWMSGGLDHAIQGGSSGGEFRDRYDAGIASLVAEHRDDATLAVFSHGAAIRVYTAFAARLPAQKALELRIMNTGMSVLDGDPEQGWRLTRWHPEPLGGPELDDSRARDVTGDAAEEVA